MTQHAALGYGGSVAARTINCPGWIKLAGELPPDAYRGSSHAADKGSVCHKAVELYLAGRVVNPQSLIGLVYGTATLDEDLLETRVLPALRMYHEHQPRGWAHRWLEQSVTVPAKGVPHGTCHGTADLLHLYDDHLDVGDWKFGWYPVEADGHQLRFYGVGALHLPELVDLPMDFPVVLSIYQPAVSLTPDRHTTTVEGLHVWLASYEGAIAQAQRVAPLRRAGSWCAFCPNRLVCPEALGETFSLAEVMPGALPPERLSELVDVSYRASDIADAVQSETKAALHQGLWVPGWQLGPGVARRSWEDDDNARDVLMAYLDAKDIVVTSIVSPAQAERLLRETGLTAGESRSIVAPLVKQTVGQPRLVRARSDAEPVDVSGFSKGLSFIRQHSGVDNE